MPLLYCVSSDACSGVSPRLDAAYGVPCDACGGQCLTSHAAQCDRCGVRCCVSANLLYATSALCIA